MRFFFLVFFPLFAFCFLSRIFPIRSLALTSYEGQAVVSFSLSTSSVSILGTGMSILLLDGYSSTFTVYCLLGQIQIWVGSVAFARCSDDLFYTMCSCALVYPFWVTCTYRALRENLLSQQSIVTIQA